MDVGIKTPLKILQGHPLEEVRDVHADAVLTGGGEADSFAAYLERVADALGLPIHFVLGNHDYIGRAAMSFVLVMRVSIELAVKHDREECEDSQPRHRQGS